MAVYWAVLRLRGASCEPAVSLQGTDQLSRLRENGLRTTLRLRLPFRRTRDELPENGRRHQLRYALDWAGAHASDLLRFPLPVRPPHCEPVTVLGLAPEPRRARAFARAR